MSDFQKNIVIAFDGPAASGKGTIARAVARMFDLAYLDTGKLYRAVAFTAIEQGLPIHQACDSDHADHVQALCSIASGVDLELIPSHLLTTDDVAQMASKVAAIQEVRLALLDYQRDFARDPKALYPSAKGAILDGRDIGTMVCPDADLKFFITADLEIRAKRRFHELKMRNISCNIDDIYNSLKERDIRDTQRGSAPLMQSDDAILVDTSDLSIDNAIHVVSKYIEEFMA